MAETELERAEKRYAQAKARLQALKNREATRQRKLDTRRKVILGGALLDLAERDSGAAAMLDRLVRNLAREQDRAWRSGIPVLPPCSTGSCATSPVNRIARPLRIGMPPPLPHPVLTRKRRPDAGRDPPL